MRNLTILISVILLGTACTEEPESIKPEINSMTESVYASVTIEPEEVYLAYSAVPGILDEVYIAEGDTVQKDQTLAKVRTDNPSLNIDNAELNVELAKENYLGQSNVLSSIQNDILLAKDQLKFDSLNYNRQQKLWDQNIGSKTTLENWKLQYERSKKNLEALFKKYEQTRIELENNYKRSQIALRKAQTDLKDYFIRSKIDGRVYTLLKNPGELINVQEPLAEIGKSKSFLIKMQVDEVDIARVKIDQKILITLDAYEGEVFEADLTRIYPQKDVRTQTFEVEALFRKPPAVLYAGLSGEANIILGKKDNIVLIPREYLIEGDHVNTPEGKVEVETGMKNLEFVEIISGIDTSIVILKP